MDTHALNDWLSKVLSGDVVGSWLLDVSIARLDLFLSIIHHLLQGEEVARKKKKLQKVCSICHSKVLSEFIHCSAESPTGRQAVPSAHIHHESKPATLFISPWIKKMSFWHMAIFNHRIRWSSTSKMKHEANKSFLSQIIQRGVERLGEITAGHINHGINYVFSQCCQGFLFANCLQTDWKSPHHIPRLKIFANFFTVWGSIRVENVIMESTIHIRAIPADPAVAFWCFCTINMQRRSQKVTVLRL